MKKGGAESGPFSPRPLCLCVSSLTAVRKRRAIHQGSSGSLATGGRAAIGKGSIHQCALRSRFRQVEHPFHPPQITARGSEPADLETWPAESFQIVRNVSRARGGFWNPIRGSGFLLSASRGMAFQAKPRANFYSPLFGVSDARVSVAAAGSVSGSREGSCDRFCPVRGNDGQRLARLRRQVHFPAAGVARVMENRPAGKQTRPRRVLFSIPGAGLFFARAALRPSSITQHLIRQFTKNGPVPSSTLDVARCVYGFDSRSRSKETTTATSRKGV
jgi:hypothetical protein